jgi:hypothetical protein
MNNNHSNLAISETIPAFSRRSTTPASGLDPVGQMELRRGLVIMAMRQVPSAAIGSLVIAFATTSVIWAGVPKAPLLAWLCAMSVVSLLRLRFGETTRRMASSGATIEALARRVAANALLAEITGLLWGVLVPVFIPHGMVQLRTAVSCVVIAMAATAIGSFAALPSAGQRFLFAALVPLGISNLIDVTGAAGVIEFLVCLSFLAVIQSTLRRSASRMVEGLAARLRAGKPVIDVRIPDLGQGYPAFSQ